ncbi:FACT complex subunit spt16 [Orbilia oligospora]|nr:FACT complex subunit spt16 [Orbilia oligospora]
MSDEIVIDKQNFSTRIATLISAWRSQRNEQFGGASSLLLLLGKSDSSGYTKTLSLFYWLLGYEFPATLMLLTFDKVYVVTTAKKAKLLHPLSTPKYPVEVLIRGKDEAENKKQLQTIVDHIKDAGKKIGILQKDYGVAQGPLVTDWNSIYKPSVEAGDIEEQDFAIGASTALQTYDEAGSKSIRQAAKASVAVIHKYFLEEMSVIIDEEKKVTHDTIGKKVEAQIDKEEFFKEKDHKLGADFAPSQLDWAYGPSIQSGGKYDLKVPGETENDKSNLHSGVIIASMGFRYKNYCSVVGRTYMIDPNKTQENHYYFLIKLHTLIISTLRDGVTCKDVYSKALNLVKSQHPELEKNFFRNVGYGINMESRDSTLILNGKNARTLQEGMTLVIHVGFQDLENPKADDKRGKTYALALTDTVEVGGKNTEAIVLTRGAPVAKDEVAFYFKDENPPEQKAKQAKPPPKASASSKNTAIMKTKLRGKREEVDDGKEQRRKENQKQLAAKKRAEGLERFPAGGTASNGVEKKQIKKFESYKRENQFPHGVGDLKIMVDVKAQTVILPIFGRPVPFHISTIKNVSKNEEDPYTHLRINLVSPGQGVGKKDELPLEEPSAHFVRSLSYRSTDRVRMADISQVIQDMKKQALKREQEKKEMEDVVTQDNLIEIKNRRPQRLQEVYVRPALDGKRVAGDIEIHQNGLRYVSPARSERIDILFSNVKHLFFQPCEHELIVIIHVHLKTPIMVGKKKTKDVQFYREAMDIQFDETGNRKRKYKYGDEEEFEAEQEERRRRAQLDKEFRAFAEKISEATKDEGLDVDIPFRELGFYGVPFRANVLCQPTTECLVQLTDPPFLVITLDEIEVAHLERVQFGLKNFDMAFVFKDFSRPVVHVNSIPMETLESVKDWLDSVNIAFTEGPLNLNWVQIMKTVTADPHLFFFDGGWKFLSTDTDDEEEEEEDEESEYEESESDFSDGEDSEDSFGSEDDDASEDEGSDASDFSEGESWDEMEEKAKKKDKDRDLSDEERPKKSKKR